MFSTVTETIRKEPAAFKTSNYMDSVCNPAIWNSAIPRPNMWDPQSCAPLTCPRNICGPASGSCSSAICGVNPSSTCTVDSSTFPAQYMVPASAAQPSSQNQAQSIFTTGISTNWSDKLKLLKNLGIEFLTKRKVIPLRSISCRIARDHTDMENGNIHGMSNKWIDINFSPEEIETQTIALNQVWENQWLPRVVSTIDQSEMNLWDFARLSDDLEAIGWVKEQFRNLMTPANIIEVAVEEVEKQVLDCVKSAVRRSYFELKGYELEFDEPVPAVTEVLFGQPMGTPIGQEGPGPAVMTRRNSAAEAAKGEARVYLDTVLQNAFVEGGF